MRVGVLEALGLMPTTRSTPITPIPPRPKRRRGLVDPRAESSRVPNPLPIGFQPPMTLKRVK